MRSSRRYLSAISLQPDTPVHQIIIDDFRRPGDDVIASRTSPGKLPRLGRGSVWAAAMLAMVAGWLFLYLEPNPSARRTWDGPWLIGDGTGRITHKLESAQTQTFRWPALVRHGWHGARNDRQEADYSRGVSGARYWQPSHHLVLGR